MPVLNGSLATTSLYRAPDHAQSVVDELLAQFDPSDIVQSIIQHLEQQIKHLTIENNLLKSETASAKNAFDEPLQSTSVAEKLVTGEEASLASTQTLFNEPLQSVSVPDKCFASTEILVASKCRNRAASVEAEITSNNESLPSSMFAETRLAGTSGTRARSARTVTLPPSERQSLTSQTPSMADSPYAGIMGRISVTTGAASQNHSPLAMLFTDTGTMRSDVCKKVLNPYDVTDFYHNEGSMTVFRRVAVSSTFELITSIVVFVNAIWISIDVDVHGRDSLEQKDFVFVVADVAFCLYFLTECLIRFLAFRRKLDCIKDTWFVFDSFLVVLNLTDIAVPVVIWIVDRGNTQSHGKTSVLRIFSLLKLSRMARVARLLRSSPELSIIIKGTFVACRSVVSALILLLGLVYVFAVFFRQLTDGTTVGANYFKSVPSSMKTLLLVAALPDQEAMISDVGDDNLITGILTALYFCFASLTIMNMLVGVLVEVIGVVSVMEREVMRVTFVKEQLSKGMKEGGVVVHKDMRIKKNDFETLINEPAVAKAIRSAGVEPSALLDFSNYIFSGRFHGIASDGLSFQQFVEVILEFGGTGAANVKDMVDMSKVVLNQLESFENNIACMLKEQLRYSKSLQVLGESVQSQAKYDHVAKRNDADDEYIEGQCNALTAPETEVDFAGHCQVDVDEWTCVSGLQNRY